MARRILEVNGVSWGVAPSGRVTPYLRDEFGLTFTRLDPVGERRFVRYSPRGAKSPDLALTQLSDADLRRLLSRSQPAWITPDAGYRR